LDLLAQKVEFEEYALTNDQVIEEVKNSITELPSKLKERTDNALKLLQTDTDSENKDLISL